MSIVMSILAASLRNDSDQMRVVAENMANADVVAYRQRIAVPQNEFSQLAAAAPDLLAESVPQMQVAIDTRPGTVKSTGEPLDVAIEGEGYFVVNTPQGELLTRRGDFHLDASGTLCAFNGEPVLGTEGVMHIKGGTAQISADGSVRVANQLIGQLDIVQPASGATLQPVADGLFASSGGEMPAGPETHVLQGFLETSNVSAVNQMVMLMQATRNFEADQHFVRAYDEMLAGAINDLGKV